MDRGPVAASPDIVAIDVGIGVAVMPRFGVVSIADEGVVKNALEPMWKGSDTAASGIGSSGEGRGELARECGQL